MEIAGANHGTIPRESNGIEKDGRMIKIFPRLGKNQLRKFLPFHREKILEELEKKEWPQGGYLSNLLDRIDSALFGMRGGKKKNEIDQSDKKE